MSNLWCKLCSSLSGEGGEFKYKKFVFIFVVVLGLGCWYFYNVGYAAGEHCVQMEELKERLEKLKEKSEAPEMKKIDDES